MEENASQTVCSKQQTAKQSYIGSERNLQQIFI